MVIEADPSYRDAGQQLDNAQRRQQFTCWQAEAHRLYRAEEWAVVVKIGERLHIVDPAAADPDGLVTAARPSSPPRNERHSSPRCTAAGCVYSTSASGSRPSMCWRGWTPTIWILRHC